MLKAGPAVQPNSAENAFASTETSCTAPTGTAAIIVCRPQLSSLLAPSSMYVVVRRLPDAVTKYVALTKRSPVPLPCRKAELKSGRLVILRPRMGVASTVCESMRRPTCASARTPSVAPYTVTVLVPPVATSFTLIVAVSPARKVSSGTFSLLNPAFSTLTLYSPVRGRAPTVAEPLTPEVRSRVAPVAVFSTDTLASGTTAPV